MLLCPRLNSIRWQNLWSEAHRMPKVDAMDDLNITVNIWKSNLMASNYIFEYTYVHNSLIIYIHLMSNNWK